MSNGVCVSCACRLCHARVIPLLAQTHCSKDTFTRSGSPGLGLGRNTDVHGQVTLKRILVPLLLRKRMIMRIRIHIHIHIACACRYICICAYAHAYTYAYCVLHALTYADRRELTNAPRLSRSLSGAPPPNTPRTLRCRRSGTSSIRHRGSSKTPWLSSSATAGAPLVQIITRNTQ